MPIMSRSRLRCVRCGRNAVYLVRASGEPLCLRCLERSIVKSVRRTLGRHAMLNPGDPVVVVEPFLAEPWFCSSLRILAKSIKSHGNTVILVRCKRDGGECPVHDYVDRVVELDAGDLLKVCENHKDHIDRIACFYRAEYLMGSMVAKNLGINTTFVMRPRDTCSLVGVMGIITMNLSLAVESLPSRKTYFGVHVVNPLYGVGSQDLAAYSYSLGLVNEDSLCSGRLDVKELPGYIEIQSIYAHSSEMIYSSAEAVREILDAMQSPRCPLCGAPAERDGFCGICSSLLPPLEKLLSSV